jgi:protein-S-isoprenylcysteine O-methyltransferase Ste14
MLSLKFLDLGNLLLGVALLFGTLIIVFEWIERRRESRRERTLLDAIEAEYRAYYRMGRL